MEDIDYDKFKNLTFEGFRELALDETLSKYEKIGFPDSYREGLEEIIFDNIKGKLKNLCKKNRVIMDIGTGCSGLAFMLIEICKRNNHQLVLIDSKEMLDHLPDNPFITKIASFYPNECKWIFDEFKNKVDSILTYSVLHYVFAESNLYDFVDKSLGMLAENGEMLIGDIPNISKRNRFFASPNGIQYHKNFTGSKEIPVVEFNKIEPGKIDDAIILSLLMRCRKSGFDAYLLPQDEALPMANRREDIIIVKP